MDSKFLLLPCLIITTLASALPVRPQGKALPDVAAIPMPPGALLEKDHQAQERAWAQRCLLKPAQQTWVGKPWAAEATALVEAALELKMKEGLLDNTLGSLAPRFRELLKAVMDEPLINVLAVQSLYAERLNWRDCKAVLNQLLHQGGLKGALECQALAAQIIQMKSQSDAENA